MSMSQEEIEALMGGAEAEDFSSDDVSVDDEITSEEVDDTDNIAIDTSSEEDFEVNEDLLNSIEGMSSDEDEPIVIEDIAEPSKHSSDVSAREDSIDDNVYPFPVSNENKVVDQLNQVADDSEEKATQIFDVLSFILDENDIIKKKNKEIQVFLDSQKELLESLAIKFPKVELFNSNLEALNTTTNTSLEMDKNIDEENNKIFEAMELMQYHDINRQKIERVMSVIKKLSNYLNGIFEDNSGKEEVQIAKHISGDSNDIVDGDDIASLIAEFSE